MIQIEAISPHLKRFVIGVAKVALADAHIPPVALLGTSVPHQIPLRFQNVAPFLDVVTWKQISTQMSRNKSLGSVSSRNISRSAKRKVRGWAQVGRNFLLLFITYFAWPCLDPA